MLSDTIVTLRRHYRQRLSEKNPVNRHFQQADGETRTPDPFITSEVLYQLSYVGGSGEL